MVRVGQHEAQRRHVFLRLQAAGKAPGSFGGSIKVTALGSLSCSLSLK